MSGNTGHGFSSNIAEEATEIVAAPALRPALEVHKPVEAGFAL
jgi:hypothetical protein